MRIDSCEDGQIFKLLLGSVSTCAADFNGVSGAASGATVFFIFQLLYSVFDVMLIGPVEIKIFLHQFYLNSKSRFMYQFLIQFFKSTDFSLTFRDNIVLIIVQAALNLLTTLQNYIIIIIFCIFDFCL